MVNILPMLALLGKGILGPRIQEIDQTNHSFAFTEV